MTTSTEILHERPGTDQSPGTGISVPGNQGVKVMRACTIRKPAAELYAFWRQVENLCMIIKHPVEITARNGRESHWAASAPFGGDRVEWDAVIINDEKDRLIAWRSLEGAEVPNAGTVRFEPAPGGQGTEVTVQLEYNPPGGRLAALFAKLTGEEPKQQVAAALSRFKALMEAGEIPTIEGQSVGEPQRSKKRKKS